eukprot:SAG22_NODE_1056_length_5777_cov_137.240402_2_plen_241_part_00
MRLLAARCPCSAAPFTLAGYYAGAGPVRARVGRCGQRIPRYAEKTRVDTYEFSGFICIPLVLSPAESNYYGVTFSDVRVFLVGLPAAGRTPITVDLVKAGVSDFKDQTGSVRRFTHDETNPPLSFTYDADRCTVMSSSDGQLQSGNLQDIYIRYSPYGTWKMQVTNGARLPLDAVTTIHVQLYRPSSSRTIASGRFRVAATLATRSRVAVDLFTSLVSDRVVTRGKGVGLCHIVPVEDRT